MKKRIWMLSMMLTIIFAFSSNGYSLHTISVLINPFLDPNYSNSSTGTFNALVTVTNTSNSIYYQYFALQTETFLQFNSVSAISNNWSPVVSGGELSLLGPPDFAALAPGESFSFWMNYTLTTSASSALTLGLWSSTNMWAMNGYVVEDPYIGFTSNQPFSTGVIPEPGTVILLGFGLLGLGFFTRMRKKRDS